MKINVTAMMILSAMMCNAGWVYENYKGGVMIGGEAISFNSTLTDKQFKYVLSASECTGVVNIPSEFNGLPLVKIDGLSFQVDSNKGFIVPETVKEISSLAFVARPTSRSNLWRYSWGWSQANVSANAEWFPAVWFDARTYLNIYFTGDKPTVVNPFVTSCYYEGEYRDCVFCAQGGLDSPKQFLYGNCWVVEGASGWETNTYFQGGLVQYYAAKTNILPARRKFVESQEVSLSCVNEAATMYYTLDGSEPVTNETVNCFRYTTPFVITENTSVKALAYVAAYSSTVTYVQHYVKATATPVVSSQITSPFYQTGKEVVLSCATPDAIIRYTLDGSEATSESAVYEAPFNISETTTIRARAFCAGIEDSDEMNVTFTREWYTVDAPVIEPSGAEFENVSQTVSLSCATEGATILYTTDGSDPKVNGREYTKPFTIYKSCTVRAIAVKYDWKDSTETTATFTRGESLSEAANFYGYTMETDSAASWTVDAAVSHDGVSSVRSGAIGNNGTTYLMASVKKAGTVSFWWKAQCEEPDEEDGEDGYYDYGAFLVDDVVKVRIAGNDTGWQFVSVEVPTGGKHVLRWEYRKDGATSYAPDCVWVDQVQWSPADGSGYTLTSPEPVPYSWLRQYNLGVASGDFEAAANAASGKTQGGAATSVWEEFVAGTDPTNALSVFTAKIEMQGATPLVTWEPDLNTNGVIRTYKIYGSETLENGGSWQYPTNSLHRFFKVTVEMP